MTLSFAPAIPPVATALLCAGGTMMTAAEPEAPRKSYNLQGGDAAETLKRFAADSGEQIVYLVDNVRGEQTRAVTGEFAAREALERMLVGTQLVLAQDPHTGALVVGRKLREKSDAVPPTKPVPEAERSKRSSKFMKSKNPITLLVGWIALAIGPVHVNRAEENAASAVQALGIITGRVSNAATQANLEGAVVRLEGTSHTAITERDGTYAFQVPAGNYSLAVSYTGLDMQTATVAVIVGGTVARDFGLTAEIYRMSAFTVSGEREGNAKAITLQRNSVGVKNVVSADAFGDLAGNPADLLVRLPGIVGDSVGGDIRNVQIRGMHHQLNSITMDGNRMADAGSAGATREFQFQQVGSDSIERIEVTKSPTPDMDADSIGGAVNMVSKSAFDRAGGRRVAGSIGAIWRAFDDRDEPRRNFSLSYSEVFGGKIGVSFNYGQRAHLSSGESSSQTHQAVMTDPIYTYQFSMDDFRNERTRWGGGLKLDYKLSEQTRFYLNTTLNKHDEHANNAGVAFATQNAVATVGANGVLGGNGGVVPGYTSGVTEWRSINNSTAIVESANTHKRGEALHVQFGAVHRFQEWNVDYDVYRSNSEAEYPGNGTFTMTARGVGLRIEQTDAPFFPNVTQVAGPDMTSINSYTENRYAILKQAGDDEYTGGAINLRKTFDTPVPTWIKFGARVREQTRDLTVGSTRWTYVGPDRVMGLNAATGVNDDNLAQFVNPIYRFGENKLLKYPKMPYPTRPMRDEPGSTDDYTGFNIDTALRQSPHLFQEDVVYNTTQELSGRQDFSERIIGAYIMGNIDLGRLNILGGVRVEDTEAEGEGAKQEITPEERARRAAWVGTVTPDEQRRRTIAEYSGRLSNKGEYRQVFPGLHFKYQVSPRLLARASYATNIGRPSIGQLIPRTNVNNENRTITTNNPSLKPQYADNFDLSLEYYFEPVGLFSAGVFLKEMKSFIFSRGGQVVEEGADNGFDGEYVGYSVTSQMNGGAAKIKGFELSYQQQFTFLPGWWSGFGAFANYTQLEAEGNYGSGGIAGNPTDEIAGFYPHTGNFGISYIRNRLSLRLQFNHIGKSLSGYNVNLASRTYRMARSTLDTKLVYKINRNFDVYFDVVNVFAEADRAFQQGNGRARNISKFSPQFFFGLNGRL